MIFYNYLLYISVDACTIEMPLFIKSMIYTDKRLHLKEIILPTLMGNVKFMI